MRFNRVAALCLAIAAHIALPFQAQAQAQAQDYPSRPVKIVVPFGPGGTADTFARQLAQHLSESLKQPFVVENRPGASSVIGTDIVAKSPPDGYTLLMMSNTHTTNESLNPKKPFVLMRDFAPVAAVNYSDIVMVVHPSVAANSVKEFIALAKKEPGKLNYASPGHATPYHIAGELFKVMTGTDLVHVPHKTANELRAAIIGGHVHMAFDAVTTIAANVQGGQVRALGTTSATKRSSVLPDIPTIAEAGVPGYEALIWNGVMAPAGTPKPVIDKLNAEINRIIANAAIKAVWDKLGAVALTMNPAEFDAYLRKDIDKWANVVKTANLAPQ